MGKWIDLALLSSETDLATEIDGLSAEERQAIMDEICAVLGVDAESLQRSFLRVLVERARPLALPKAMWGRPLSATWSIRGALTAHWQRLGMQATQERLLAGQRLYAQFAVDRKKVPVTEAALTAQGFRCAHCGLAFCNEELSTKSIVSPLGYRGGIKHDPLKPQWHKPELREPTVDHNWPVSLYGDNESSNLKVLCQGCNNGKADLLALEHSREFSGLPRRQDLIRGTPISEGLFYAQLRKQPRCIRTGVSVDDAELTVELKDNHVAPVLDNLVTVVSPGL